MVRRVTEEIKVCGRVGWRRPALNEDFSSEWSPPHVTRTGKETRAGRQKGRPSVGIGVACLETRREAAMTDTFRK